MADDEAPAPCPTCGTPIEPEYAERLREQQAKAIQTLRDLQAQVAALLASSHTLREGCIAVLEALGTPVPVAAGTSEPVDAEATLHPTGRCTCGGEGRCPWCLSHCDHCGAGTLVQQLRAGPISIDDVPWLVKDFDVLYRVAKAAVHSAQSGAFITHELIALQVHLQRLAPALEQIQAVKAALRDGVKR